jgi:hypothetical protein
MYVYLEEKERKRETAMDQKTRPKDPERGSCFRRWYFHSQIHAVRHVFGSQVVGRDETVIVMFLQEHFQVIAMHGMKSLMREETGRFIISRKRRIKDAVFISYLQAPHQMKVLYGIPSVVAAAVVSC